MIITWITLFCLVAFGLIMSGCFDTLKCHWGTAIIFLLFCWVWHKFYFSSSRVELFFRIVIELKVCVKEIATGFWIYIKLTLKLMMWINWIEIWKSLCYFRGCDRNMLLTYSLRCWLVSHAFSIRLISDFGLSFTMSDLCWMFEILLCSYLGFSFLILEIKFN